MRFDNAAEKARYAKNTARARRRGLPEGDPRHGTPVGWTRYQCSCVVCWSHSTPTRWGRYVEALCDGASTEDLEYEARIDHSHRLSVSSKRTRS